MCEIQIKVMKNRVAISACLLGVPCRYNGTGKLNEKAIKIFTDHKAIAICPEVLGGLATPRPACEIIGGDGSDVLSGKTKALDKDGNDYTKEFIAGAKNALKIIKDLGIKKIYLKSRSPSCAAGEMYDGTFSGNIVTGNGVFAALLTQEGIESESI